MTVSIIHCYSKEFHGIILSLFRFYNSIVASIVGLVLCIPVFHAPVLYLELIIDLEKSKMSLYNYLVIGKCLSSRYGFLVHGEEYSVFIKSTFTPVFRYPIIKYFFIC